VHQIGAHPAEPNHSNLHVFTNLKVDVQGAET